MPKCVIPVKYASERSDKAESARLRAIGDLIEIEQNAKMYINQKKQLQALVMNLYALGFYIDKPSMFGVL